MFLVNAFWCDSIRFYEAILRNLQELALKHMILSTVALLKRRKWKVVFSYKCSSNRDPVATSRPDWKTLKTLKTLRRSRKRLRSCVPHICRAVAVQWVWPGCTPPHPSTRRSGGCRSRLQGVGPCSSLLQFCLLPPATAPAQEVFQLHHQQAVRSCNCKPRPTTGSSCSCTVAKPHQAPPSTTKPHQAPPHRVAFSEHNWSASWRARHGFKSQNNNKWNQQVCVFHCKKTFGLSSIPLNWVKWLLFLSAEDEEV